MSPTAVTTLFLMVALGVRHGCDPEHLAIVNAVTLRAAERGRRWPAASGLYFALGHGLVITAVAIAFVGVLDTLRVPGWVRALGEWLPALILLAVAVANLAELLRDRSDYRPVAIKGRLLPRRLGDASSPLAAFLIGVLFAPFVDPAAQAAVWGYVATAGIGSGGIALLGAVLTAAMALTCTLEAHAVVRLMGRRDERRAARRRRLVGWLIVALAYAVLGYMAGSTLYPARSALLLQSVTSVAAAAALAALSVTSLRLWQRLKAVRVRAPRAHAQNGMSSSSKPPLSPAAGADAALRSRPPDGAAPSP
ncbi:MAG TPA: hypothetical protein VF265_10705 [Nevskiaceae bacterium]